MSESSPLSREDALLVFGSVVGTRAVLVGGQAVSFWAELYREQGRLPEIARETEMFVSRDVDFLGGYSEAEVCARRLRGALHEQNAPWESIPVSAAQVHFVDRHGHRRIVDFLINVCGVDRADEVRSCAVAFDVEGEHGPLYVMDPVTCMRARLANIRLLGRTDGKSLHQARISIWLVREWLLDRADLDGVRDALRWIEWVFRYARRHKDARHGARHHGLEAFDAIVPHERLPDRFRSVRYPQMKEIIARERARLSERRDGGAS